MKKYYIIRPILLILTGVALLVLSCEKDPDPDPDVNLSKEVLILNYWIWDGMSDLYLWEEFMPTLSPNKEPDPEAFFYKLLYEDDHDSWIVDDYEALVAMFDGVQLATGASSSPILVGDDEVVWVVEYVTPGSPAADSGIARGDIIYAVDGQPFDTDNYIHLYYKTTATLEFADWDGMQIIPNGRKITLTAVELNQNPVVHSEVIDYQGYRIGYFVYTQFTTGQNNEWLTELKGVFEEFRSQGVSDVVVDLRYNPGGNLGLSAYIASTLGPVEAMQNNDIFVRLLWNNLMNNYWKSLDRDGDGKPDGENSDQLLIRLPDSDLNLDLSTAYFLTTDNTASACESLMTGLYPYMEVVQIGQTTYGKVFGSVTIDDWENPKRHNWAMQPIVLKYSNADGFTDFVNGLQPDFFVEERLLYLEPFGSEDDPFLAKALEEITGVAPAVKKSVAPEIHVAPLAVPRKPVPERIMSGKDLIGNGILF